MSTILTAEEIGNKHDMTDRQKSAMIEFAKLHVEAQQKAILESHRFYHQIDEYNHDDYISEWSIARSYPLSNIK
jgi:hypothetical protein